MKNTAICLLPLLLFVLFAAADDDPASAKTAPEKSSAPESTAESPPSGAGATPASWQEHFQQGLELYEKGDFAGAISRFQRAEVETDKLPWVRFNEGLCHLALGEWESGEKAFQQASSPSDPLTSLKATYNLGHLYYQQSLQPTTDQGQVLIKEGPAAKALDCFRDAIRQAGLAPLSGTKEAGKIVHDAKKNQQILVMRLKDLVDKASREKGGRVNSIQGVVKVNGRAQAGAFVFFKSKWEDGILGNCRSAEAGVYKLPDLDTGKYNLAAALYEEDDAKKLAWGEAVKVPAFQKDTHDLQVQGALSLGCSYKASCQALDSPWDDHSRLSGAKSIASSTDWGELTDGRPSSGFPEKSDLDMGFVAFGEERFQIAMALPPAQQPPQADKTENTTEPSAPPQYMVSLKGFYDGKDAVLPSEFEIFGAKEGQDKAEKLYSGKVESTASGRYEWSAPAFDQKGCRSLIFSFVRSGGQRISLHEIEVNEQSPSKKNDEKDDKDQKKDEQKPEQQPQPQEQEEQASKPTQDILQNIRKKREDQEEKERGRIKVLRADKDW